MSAIRAKENRVESALRKALFALGLRYRKYPANLPGRPDIVFAKAKVVVFVDGDFWHARVLAEGGASQFRKYLRDLPEDTRGYWKDKFENRLKRDERITNLLTSSGWTVLRYWESNVRRNIQEHAILICGEIRRRLDGV